MMYKNIFFVAHIYYLVFFFQQRIPFWIDPIWSNKAEEPNPSIVNVRAEFSSKNAFPLLLSPYTISKNENKKRKLLGMHNHDRKIA